MTKIKKKYLLNHFVDQMIGNYHLASLQLVLHKKKNACCITIKIDPQYLLKFKFKTIEYKNFVWNFSKIGLNHFAVFVYHKRLNILNPKIKNTLESFNIQTKVNANKDFAFLIKKIAFRKTYFKYRSNKQAIIDNIIMGHCYSYPTQNIKDFISYNYLNNPKQLTRKGLFFFTDHDQCGIMSYRKKCNYFNKLKNDYIKICNKNKVKINFKNTYEHLVIK